MKIDITIRHRPEDAARAQHEMSNLLGELGPLCELADTRLIEDSSVGSFEDWLKS